MLSLLYFDGITAALVQLMWKSSNKLDNLISSFRNGAWRGLK